MKNMTTRTVQVQDSGRVETGMIVFPGDWPGLFIRGDDAARLADAIDYICANRPAGADFNLQLAHSGIKAVADMIRNQVIVP